MIHELYKLCGSNEFSPNFGIWCIKTCKQSVTYKNLKILHGDGFDQGKEKQNQKSLAIIFHFSLHY